MANVLIELDYNLEPVLASNRRIQDLKTYHTRIYTSRSVIETGQRCPRKRYLSTMLNGIGIAPKIVSFPLVTGSMVHNGVAAILAKHKATGPVDKEFAKQIANDTTEYADYLIAQGYFENNEKLPGELEYTFHEQSSLYSALVYAWYLMEYPVLTESYNVLGVEKDIALFIPMGIDDGFICFESRADAILQAKGSGEIVGYNLKTSNRWDDRNRESFKDGLQSITEIWALERYIKWLNMSLEHTAEGLEALLGNAKAAATVRGRKIEAHVSGVRLCVLRKGNTREGKVYNGLIKPYRRVSGPTGEVEYAVEYTFPQPLNKSGYGRLGAGWEGFNIWESSDWGITDWLDKLMTGDIQPELGANPLSNYVFSIPDYGQSKAQRNAAIDDIIVREIDWAVFKKGLGPLAPPVPLLAEQKRAKVEMYRQSCHFPTDCEFYHVCYDSHVALHPLENSDRYEPRKPHHAAEAEG